MPGGLGREAAGVVVAFGKKVRGFRVGDRVAYVIGVPGSYCDVRNVPASRVVKIPAGVSDEQAAVLMLKGLTACYLLRHTYRVRRGDVIVVHAAAGGVGALLTQWGRKLGASGHRHRRQRGQGEAREEEWLPARAGARAR